MTNFGELELVENDWSSNTVSEQSLDKLSMETIFQSPYLERCFERYAVSRFAEENVLFVKDVIRTKSLLGVLLVSLQTLTHN